MMGEKELVADVCQGGAAVSQQDASVQAVVLSPCQVVL